MTIIISPARGFGLEGRPDIQMTSPEHIKSASQLAALLQAYSPWELESILKTNPKLALQAWEYYQQFSPGAGGTPSLLAYRGLVYAGIAPDSFTTDEFRFAADHLRILSAFYGVLRPTDSISPYRLELVSKLRPGGKSLYAFWGDKLYQSLFAPSEPVLNLCSAEYSKAVTPFLQQSDQFITCDFLTNKQGKLRCITTSAKSARGQMVRYLVQNRINTPEEVCRFSWDGYEYAPQLSTSTRLAFVR